MSEPFPVEVRVDPDAPKGELASALAALLLDRARRAIGERPEPTTADPRPRTGCRR
jgi:hypothetical protein